MLIPFVTRKLAELRARSDSGLEFPALLGATAFVFTLSMLLPFSVVIAVAVLLAPKRWPSCVLASGLGSSAGSLVLYLVFHHLGWNQLIDIYPEIASSSAWSDANRWLSTYGILALFVIAALPLPQTPALIFTAIYRLPAGEVWLVVLLGKLVKYSLYALAVKAFPTWFTNCHLALLMQTPTRN